MRKVLKQSEVAHFWANQTQSEGTNPVRTFYFNGNTIYSYGSHFPIATHHNGKVLFTYRTYSPSTSLHTWDAEKACSHIEKVYCYDPKEASQGYHLGNFNDWKSQAKNQLEKLKKAKKPSIYIAELTRIRLDVEKYCEFLEVSAPSELTDLLAITTDSTNLEESLKLLKEKAKREEEQKRLKIEHELEEWANFETDHLPRLDRDYLRYNKEKNRVETSQRVEIPLELARKLWVSVKEGTVKPGDKVLHYSVRSVGETIEIGCHTFPVDYLVKFGEGLFIASAQDTPVLA